jgi:uncharacterized LabA/DUF88 family protein
MAAPNDSISMALYCDFENVALGVRDAKYEKFNIRPVLERLLLKGSIVVKKAYCDWDRYKEFKPQMHEASFELIEIPHVRQSGKNSADIRLVVDALDLCYTKAHVNTFVIISGDSDFSPLVSKLRENAKYVIGVGVKDSTSDLLVSNCDEFIFIDDLVRESRRAAASRETRQSPSAARRPAPVEDEHRPRESLEVRKNRAIDVASETFEALMAERGDSGKIWASALKQAIKRRKPDFNEVYFGFRTFGNLLEEAQARGLLEIGRDDKSGSYVYRSSRAPTAEAANAGQAAILATLGAAADATQETGQDSRNDARAGRRTPAQPSPTDMAMPVHAPSLPLHADEAATAAALPASRHGAPQYQGRAPEAERLDGVDVAAAPPEQAAPQGADAAIAHVQEPAAVPAPDDSHARRGRRSGRKSAQRQEREASPAAADAAPVLPEPPPAAPEMELPVSNSQRRSARAARKQARGPKQAAAPEVPASAGAETQPPAPAEEGAAANGRRRGSRSGRGKAQADGAQDTSAADHGDQPPAEEAVAGARPVAAKKSSSRSGRPRKSRTDASTE